MNAVAMRPGSWSVSCASSLASRFAGFYRARVVGVNLRAESRAWRRPTEGFDGRHGRPRRTRATDTTDPADRARSWGRPLPVPGIVRRAPPWNPLARALAHDLPRILCLPDRQADGICPVAGRAHGQCDRLLPRSSGLGHHPRRGHPLDPRRQGGPGPPRGPRVVGGVRDRRGALLDGHGVPRREGPPARADAAQRHRDRPRPDRAQDGRAGRVRHRQDRPHPLRGSGAIRDR